MKKLLIVFVLFVYSVPASAFLVIYSMLSQDSSDASSLGAFVIPIILMGIVCVLAVINIAGAVGSAAREKCFPFKTVMVFKLSLIPFYIVNFACWAFASMVFHIALVIWPLIPFIIAYTYLTVLGTSAHVIAKLLTLRRRNIITSKQFVRHCILQLVFALDVIDCVYLAVKQKRFESIPEQRP